MRAIKRTLVDVTVVHRETLKKCGTLADSNATIKSRQPLTPH